MPAVFSPVISPSRVAWPSALFAKGSDSTNRAGIVSAEDALAATT
jgi:hypothetical protein